MSADPKTTPAVGTPLAGDTVTATWYALMKLAFGDQDTATRVTDTTPLPVGGPLFGTLADAAWDGVAANPSLLALFKARRYPGHERNTD
jgi:hypothetical protein